MTSIFPKTRGIYRVVAVLSAATAVSCLSPHNIRVIETDPDGWSSGRAVSVAYDNGDTVSARTLYVVARLSNAFRYDRLALAVTTTTPEGFKWRDTIYLSTFDHEPDAGLFFDREQPFREHTTLSRPGRYLFTFAPLMPEDPVTGVTAVGIDIR